jgi:hypothetical protein
VEKMMGSKDNVKRGAIRNIQQIIEKSTEEEHKKVDLVSLIMQQVED